MFDKAFRGMDIDKITSCSWGGNFFASDQNSMGTFGHLYWEHKSFWMDMRMFASCWSLDHIEQGHKFFEIKSPIR